MDDQGFFILSLDTELATGRFDRDVLRQKLFSPNGSRERESIRRLVDLLEGYGITGTWAIVGHLFFEKCEHCEHCPLMDWKGRYTSFDEVYGTSNPLWYGADIIDMIRTRGARQEIGFHGYSHKVFSESLMSSQDARIEVQEWQRLADRKSIQPYAVTFPRNQAGHLDILRDAGMICYRGEQESSQLSQIKYFGKILKTIDQLIGLSDIPVFDLHCEENSGLVLLRSSQFLFDINRRFELLLDSINLHNLRTRRIINAVRKAAREKKMIHLWAHPCEFRTEKDFLKLQNIITAVAEEVDRGMMRSVGMAEMARLLKENHKTTIRREECTSQSS